MKKKVKGFMHFLHGRLWGRVFLCLVIAGVILLGKSQLLESQEWFEKTRLATYDTIQRVLSERQTPDPPVMLVDISKIGKESGENEAPQDPGEQVHAVSRSELKTLITQIAKSRPVAIGVDVDFSGDANGNPITAEDPDFFNDCLKIEKETGVQLFLGVYRRAASPSDNWLGQADWAALAAGLGAGNEESQRHALDVELPTDWVVRMYCWTRVKGVKTELNSLAYALAKTVRQQPNELPSWLDWALETRTDYAPDVNLETNGFLVDYRLLSSISSITVPLSDVAVAPPDRFRGRVVILGTARHENDDGRKEMKDDDLFHVPGHVGLYSGSYLHACAVDTLVNSPLRKWTATGTVIADFLLALCAIGLVEFLNYLLFGRKGQHVHHFRMHWSVTFAIAILVGLVSIPFVGVVRLVWDDSLFVALGLLAHTGVEHYVSLSLAEHHAEEEKEPEPIDPDVPSVEKEEAPPDAKKETEQ